MDFTLGFQTVAVGAAAPLLEIFCVAAVVDKIYLVEIGLFNVAGTAGSFGLCRPTLGTAAAATNVLPVDTDEDLAAAPANVDTAWGVAPVVAATHLRQWGHTASVGAGVVWNFGKGINIDGGASLAVFNIGAGACSLLDCYVTLRI